MGLRTFSGMRPTGKLHLGHMAGALTNWIKLQDDEQYSCFYGIVDWHAMMSDYADSSVILGNCREVFLDWLAVGLDPEKSTIFVQSHVPEHAELALALGMITPLGWLQRNPTYKEQIVNIQNKDLSTFGFLGYPVLMAADILLYRSSVVPVGEDQTAHLEITREIARRFNNFYNEVFPEPDILLTPTPKVPGTDGRKMSKSYGNSINIADTEKEMWDKLRTMMTDPARQRKTDPGEPTKCPVWDIHKVFNDDDEQKEELATCCRAGSIGCVQCKKALKEHVVATMIPIWERRTWYEAHQETLDELLWEGARKARTVARETMDAVWSAIGLPPKPVSTVG
ncbi:MAG: tryptophan--tRNA ligase [Dethiosulfovibrio peptidovorans]|nr:MAG: tryptophan--tRNA ligase [Dethiosulfovibrio peptidovorans]